MTNKSLTTSKHVQPTQDKNHNNIVSDIKNPQPLPLYKKIIASIHKFNQSIVEITTNLIVIEKMPTINKLKRLIYHIHKTHSNNRKRLLRKYGINTHKLFTSATSTQIPATMAQLTSKQVYNKLRYSLLNSQLSKCRYPQLKTIINIINTNQKQ